MIMGLIGKFFMEKGLIGIVDRLDSKIAFFGHPNFFERFVSKLLTESNAIKSEVLDGSIVVKKNLNLLARNLVDDLTFFGWPLKKSSST